MIKADEHCTEFEGGLAGDDEVRADFVGIPVAALDDSCLPE